MIFTSEQRAKLEATMVRILTELWHRKWQDKVSFISQGYAQEKCDELMKTLETMEPVNPFSKSIVNEEESNLDDPHFAGEKGYEKEIDQRRLNKQLFTVFHFMMDGQWHTQQEIADAGVNITSIRSRLADLRMKRWGGHQVLSERVRDNSGLWHYKLIPNKDSLTFQHYMETLSSKS